MSEASKPRKKKKTSPPESISCEVSQQQNQKTLAAILRTLRADLSWSQIHKLIDSERVTIRGEVCRDNARRVRTGEVVELLEIPRKRSQATAQLQLNYLDRQLAVCDKPSGMPTVRHRKEKNWSEQRRELSPTAEDEVRELIAIELEWQHERLAPPVLAVHRIDKSTSGLVVFARTPEAELHLIEQFRARTPVRIYHAIVLGHPTEQAVHSRLIRNRGDGLRGSTTQKGVGQEAITHIRPLKKIGRWSLVECRLETGRTHQIRIHLAELGNPVCGDTLYFSPTVDGKVREDTSGAPRLALHAAQLIIKHPSNEEPMELDSPLAADLQTWVDRLS